MQIEMTNIRYDDKYIYATGEDLLTGYVQNIRIARDNDKDFWCEKEYASVFFRGAVELLCTLEEKGNLPSKMSFMWE